MKAVVILAALLLLAGPVAAQTLPSTSGDPLKEICTGFLQQGSGTVSADHQKLCTCLVAETQKRLTLEEMAAYNAAAVNGQPPPPATLQKVMGIATACLTQAAR